MRFLLFIRPAVLIIFLMGCGGSSKTASTRNTSSAAFSKNELLQRINAIRSKGCNCGGVRYKPTQPVNWNNKLQQAAENHSRYMNQTQRLSHTGKNSSSPGSRLKTVEYRWSYVAENIALGQRTTEEVMQSWLKSSGHCKNIMSPQVSEIGAARVGGYWTLVLAHP